MVGWGNEGWYDTCSGKPKLLVPAKCAAQKCLALCMNCGPGCWSGGYYDSCTLSPILKGVDCVECRPVCEKIGTKSEGWYDGCTKKLLKWDSCKGCKATCKNLGPWSNSNGYYSSCDPSLALKYTECVP
jgi:hypothetical protein